MSKLQCKKKLSGCIKNVQHLSCALGKDTPSIVKKNTCKAELKNWTFKSTGGRAACFVTSAVGNSWIYKMCFKVSGPSTMLHALPSFPQT